MESLRLDVETYVEPYGITTTIVEPGFVRTELLAEGASRIWPEVSIGDYADHRRQTIQAWKAVNGTQGGGLHQQPPLKNVTGPDERQRNQQQRRRCETPSMPGNEAAGEDRTEEHMRRSHER